MANSDKYDNPKYPLIDVYDSDEYVLVINGEYIPEN